MTCSFTTTSQQPHAVMFASYWQQHLGFSSLFRVLFSCDKRTILLCLCVNFHLRARRNILRNKALLPKLPKDLRKLATANTVLHLVLTKKSELIFNNKDVFPQVYIDIF